ncbi:hypothetical protein FJTKL_00806 [Diaporthe vaccinii]|uniref:Uncharacterized protein n=1 Tax=Diaporthe vaccinii TaxID=105482 RepID=A0ABR4E2B3_9PEZI
MAKAPQDEEVLFGVLTACDSKDKLEYAEQRIYINQLKNNCTKLKWIQSKKLLPITLEEEGSYKHEVLRDPSAKAKITIKNQMPQAPLFNFNNSTKVFHNQNAKFMPQRIDVTYTKDAAMLLQYSYNCTPALHVFGVSVYAQLWVTQFDRTNTTAPHD